jgi:DNA (cytosine-5)-methyltransferase 1
MTDGRYNVLDLFSGAGGLTEGFCQTGQFDIISHVEMNPFAAQTLETRMLYYSLKEHGLEDIYDEYMRNYSVKDARQTFINKCSDAGIPETGVINKAIQDDTRVEIVRAIRSRAGKRKIDVIIGGPPCQAYSTLGRWKLDRDPALTDPRLYLYRQYMHCLEKFKPRMFVFENVPGLKSACEGRFIQNIEKSMNAAGYNVKIQTLDAADFGVIQHRKRIIIIGWKKREKIDLPDFETREPAGTVHDLIMEDLPIIDAGFGPEVQEYRAPPNSYLKNYGIRDESQDVLLHHVARPHCERDLKIYSLAIQAMQEGRRIRYPDLPEELRTHRNVSSFVDRFKVVNEKGLSHSMVAHISKDGHYYIHPNPEHPRSLTVREAARVQSFPDNYIFEGSRGAKFTQIGNAVPPLMAKGIAEKLLECL